MAFGTCPLIKAQLRGGVAMNSTPPKTYMEPQNGGLEDDFPFQRGVIFQFHVSFRGSMLLNLIVFFPVY